jgi:hypothetical protein
MDAHVTAHLPVEEESATPTVRAPSATAESSTERGFRKGGPEPSVRLPGEAEEPSLGESFEECSGISALETVERLSAVARPWLGHPRTLLLCAAVIVCCVAGATAFVVFPGNHASPVPQMASTLRHWAAEMGIKRTEPLAPAASLAEMSTEPAEPVTREKYQPKGRDQQLQEVLALRNGAPQALRGGRQPANEPPAAAAPAPGQGGASDRDAPPPGYVPSEPGTNPAPPPGAQRAQPAVEATGGTSASPAVTPPAPPVVEPPPDATTAVLAALGPTSQPAGSFPPSVAPPAPAAAAAPAASPVKTSDPVEAAGELRPAPLTPADQVQVLELVTQMAAMVRDLRAQHAQLRADFGKAGADNTARLADFERRLALAEARHALSAAQIAGEPLAAVPPASAPAPAEGAPAVPGPGARQVSSATAVTAPVVLTAVAAALPTSDKGPPKRYRVQAASPGLALLAEIDRGGGDGAQLEVLVGDTVPGYGKITSIGQRGTAWVVTTEHGNIQ